MPNPIVIRADGVFSMRKIACQKEARDRMRFEKKSHVGLCRPLWGARQQSHRTAGVCQ